MSRWLLDTNIVSELRRPRPEPKVQAFVTAQPEDSLFISTVSFAELRFGIERLSEAARRTELNEWLEVLRSMFDQRVLPITEDVMLRWRIILEDGRKRRHTYAQPDLIIAATAYHHRLVLVTRNISDFAQAGIETHNPWLG